jgi:hypothetical protein
MTNRPAHLRIVWLLLMLVSPALAEDGLFRSATYCHALNENQSPKDPAEFFRTGETVCLSIALKGRPTSGIVAARFLFRDELIAETKVDVATVNKGIVLSVGQDTYAGFTLTPEGKLPVGDNYKAEVTLDGKPLGTFPFRILPPADALPSKVTSTVLAHEVDDKRNPVGIAKKFDSEDKIVLAGRGDLGNATWLEVDWIIGGKSDPDGIRSIMISENKKDVPFFFSYRPKEGWPPGNHEAVLVMNGKEVARQPFTINAAFLQITEIYEVKRSVLYRDDGKGAKGAEVTSFTTGDHVLHASFFLDRNAVIRGSQVAWSLIKSDSGTKPQEIGAATIGDVGSKNVVDGFLTFKSDPPAGTYRVDLIRNGKVVSSKEFEVTPKSSAGSPSVGDGLKQ